MSDQNSEEIHDRLQRLERRVEELEQQLEQKSEPDPAPQTPFAGEQRSHQEKQKASGLFSEQVQVGEQWLNRIGIALLLIGIAFLFKYSIDQGWLIPPVRSVIGLGIGGLLFGSGLRMDEQMNPFRQLLLGGGIAVFYITGFATFQLYSFMPAGLIWAFMIVVTLLALSLSLQQDEAILSVTGILGALGTPFMLYSGSGSMAMLVAYAALVLSAAAIIYDRKGWSSLLWSMLVGGLSVMAVGVLASFFEVQSLSTADHWILQAGMIFWALSTWGIAIRYALNHREEQPGTTIHTCVFWVPLWLLPLMAMHWDLSADGSSFVAFGLAGVGLAGYILLKQKGLKELAFSHGFMGLLMVTAGIILLFEGTMLFVLLSAEAVIMRYIANRTGDMRLNVSAHGLFFIVVIWIANSLHWGSPGITVESIAQLLFIIASGTLISYWLRRSDLKMLYRLCSHLLLLYWIYQLFTPFPDGQAWVTILWGLYAIGLLAAGFTTYGKNVRLAGMGTIFLVVGKLFLVDLSQLPAIWRILLFIGFGGSLILLGYYLQSKWSDTVN